MNDGDEIQSRLIAIMSRVAGGDCGEDYWVSEYDVTPESHLVNDLDIDDLTMLDIIVSSEVEFDVAIPDEALPGLQTVGDLVAYISEHRNEAGL